MSQSGAQAHPDCITKFNELKLGKALKWIIFKLSDDKKEIVVEDASDDKDYEVFREKLISAKSKSKTGAEGKGPRYAVYDFEYPTADGTRNKIAFIAWSPDDANTMAKMTYASSKDAIKKALNGVSAEVQANDADDIEFDEIVKVVSKGMAIKA